MSEAAVNVVVFDEPAVVADNLVESDDDLLAPVEFVACRFCNTRLKIAHTDSVKCVFACYRVIHDHLTVKHQLSGDRRSEEVMHHRNMLQKHRDGRIVVDVPQLPAYREYSSQPHAMWPSGMVMINSGSGIPAVEPPNNDLFGERGSLRPYKKWFQLGFGIHTNADVMLAAERAMAHLRVRVVGKDATISKWLSAGGGWRKDII
jgi:hypothetical protein